MTIHGNSAIIPREFGTGDLSALYNGEMSERFKELVLKTSDAATRRGFESHSLRHKSTIGNESGLFVLH